jgi:hypothetical protein
MPVVTVYRVVHSLEDVISATYGGTGVRATIACNNDSVRLHSVSALGVTTNTTLTFADYPTTTLMEAAIEAVTDWSSSVLFDVPCTDLWPSPGFSALLTTANLAAPSTVCTDYEVDLDHGEIMLPGFTNGRYYHVIVDYNAGETAIPDDLALICNEMAASAYKLRSHDTTLTSESIGDYSYTLVDSVKIEDGLIDRLRRYSKFFV